MALLEAAHQGYEYQDLMAACRLVDVLLGSITTTYVDKKFVPRDVFDDLTTVDSAGCRERVQFKYTDELDRPLTLATFTSDVRGLSLNRLISSTVADRDGPGIGATQLSFRVVLRDTVPTDANLGAALSTALPDPGPFVQGMKSLRFRLRPEALWEAAGQTTPERPTDSIPFAFLRFGPNAVERRTLDWVCRHLVVELNAPPASLDLTRPGAAEHLLLKRVRDEVGAGMYPNEHRLEVDVAAALIGCARAARNGTLTVTAPELLRRTQLRVDFGAVVRRHPVDSSAEVLRPPTVSALVQQVTDAAAEGNVVLLDGPPGHGKSWICKQVVSDLLVRNWLVAEHYCYLGDADTERHARVHAESVLGSLLARITEDDPHLVSEQRPRFAANEEAVERAVAVALAKEPNRNVALVIDGIDHVTRVLGGSASVDPSFALAQVLAGLHLPKGSTLIVLSQLGGHLKPLKDAGAVPVPVPGLTDCELRELAVHMRVLGKQSAPPPSNSAPLPFDHPDADEFVNALCARSSGNALYATYLCREVLRSAATAVHPAATVRSLPQFDGTLRTYYEHIQFSLGPRAAWVADVIALTDFPLSRGELKQISPESAHYVSEAVDALCPVLSENAAQGGVRIYHESFARFLREPYRDCPVARTALLDKIIVWLENQGMFDDPRSFGHLLRTLSLAGRHKKVVDSVDREFVVNSIAHGFPASSIIGNLAIAIDSAGRIGEWPAIVRYVEMSRAADTYEYERFESTIVKFADVMGSLLKEDALASRLLHDGRPTVPARSGLQVCATLDARGTVAPWSEYLLAYVKETRDDTTHYDGDSDTAVLASLMRGWLRLASLERSQWSNSMSQCPFLHTQGAGDAELFEPVDWDRFAAWVDESPLDPADAVDAVLDTFGLPAVVELIGKVAHPGNYYMVLAQLADSGSISDSDRDARYWATQSAAYGAPAGSVSRLIELGVDPSVIDPSPLKDARKRLEQLTRNMQDGVTYFETTGVVQWTDSCALAARSDQIGLAVAEALLKGPGWYTCWLRFVIALVLAEARPTHERSQAGLKALRILTEVTNPFLGDPRACDLYSIRALIRQTIWRAVHLLDDEVWKEGIELLNCVSDATTTSLQGEMGGPLPRDELLELAVDTAPPSQKVFAQALVDAEIETGGGGRYYSDLAWYRLIAARLALKMGNTAEGRCHWKHACRLLTAYGVRKDATIYELLDSLPTLMSLDAARGRVAVAKLQSVCDRIPEHTDGKGTWHTPKRWWRLLAAADPCAAAGLIIPSLLGECNNPDRLLHGVRSDLWRAWHHRADPVVAGALRLTLEEPLDKSDPPALDLLANECDGSGRDLSSRLLVLLLARIDERPFRYSDSNSDELLSRDWNRVEALNAISARVAAPRIAPLPRSGDQRKDEPTTSADTQQSPPVVHMPEESTPMFPPSVDGLAVTVRAWRNRSYNEARPGWAVDRFANALGYRLLEFTDVGPESEAETILRSIADALQFDDRSGLLKALAEGLERHGRLRLAVVAYVLAWTRSRGGGGWLTFGGNSQIDSLQRAARLDRTLVLHTVAGEVQRALVRGLGSLGLTQALVFGFAKGGIDASGSLPFDIWEEAFAVIAERVPRVAAIDDPDAVYVPPDSDAGDKLLGNIDVAFAAMVLAGLAHPGREQKRRTLVAVQLLLDHCPTSVAPAFASALSSLSDPATLTWLLRVIELAGDRAAPIIAASRSALIDLAQGHWLTVRVLARRLLSGDDVPPVPTDDPDRALLGAQSGDLLLPEGVNAGGTRTETSSVVTGQAGVRLSRAEPFLAGLGEAVCERFDLIQNDERFRKRMQSQFRVLTSASTHRTPDAYLAWNEAIEDALQRASTGARAARMMMGQPYVDPFELEQLLSDALLDDPTLPLTLERTRHPRPDVPPPPQRGDLLWKALRDRAEGGAFGDTGVQAARHGDKKLCGTVSIGAIESTSTLEGGLYAGWRLIASAEERAIAKDSLDRTPDDMATRFRVVELGEGGFREGLILLPVCRGDLRAWSSAPPSQPAVWDGSSTKPIVGLDVDIRLAEDGRGGIGVQRNLFSPTPWLVTALGIRQGSDFVLDDRLGPALALVTWRTEYEGGEYELAWPRLCGAGLVVRGDVFDRLVNAARGRLIFRDFLDGSSSLCD